MKLSILRHDKAIIVVDESNKIIFTSNGIDTKEVLEIIHKVNNFDELNKQNEALKAFFNELIDGILAEVDKDGWCRLVATKEKALEMKEFINNL